MKIQKLDVVLDRDGKNTLVEGFSTEYSGIKDFRKPGQDFACKDVKNGYNEKGWDFRRFLLLVSENGDIIKKRK